MSFKLTILGCDSAIPVIDKNPTAQLLNITERFFLIDCGEGTQIQLLRYKLNCMRINHIFISHLHGDHYLGLIGLITTMHLKRRVEGLNLYAHEELKEIIHLHFEASMTTLSFPLFFHDISKKEDQILYEDEDVQISSILLDHTIPSSGFLFHLKERSKKLFKDKIQEYNMPISDLSKIKAGSDFVTNKEETIKNRELTKNPNTQLISYAFFSDTRFTQNNIEKINGVTLLYHEATFMSREMDLAKKTGHSTSIDAGNMAKKAQVKKLLIGHFSKRYNDINDILQETKSIFLNTELAKDGLTLDLDSI